MHDIKNDRFTAFESIDTDQLTAVTGGGEGDSPPPSPGKKAARTFGGFVFQQLLQPVINAAFAPPSKAFRDYAAYQMEANRSRLLRDAYSGGKGN